MSLSKDGKIQGNMLNSAKATERRKEKMAVTFRVHPHSINPGVQVADILIDGKMVAAIYPDGEKGIKLVSTLENVQQRGVGSYPPIPDIRIRFDPQPYTIKEGRTVKFPKKQ